MPVNNQFQELVLKTLVISVHKSCKYYEILQTDSYLVYVNTKSLNWSSFSLMDYLILSGIRS